MENFIMGKGLWDYITGEQEYFEVGFEPNKENVEAHQTWQARVEAYKKWIKNSRKVMHWISLCISDFFIPHVKKAQSPKEEWEILARMNSSNAEPQKVHLKQRLHCVWQGNRSISDYVTEIKQIQDLASINVEVPDDDLVSVTLNGLGPEYKSLDTSISIQGHMPDFEELVNLCLQEKLKLDKSGPSA
ncbi:hypothetical protein L7F22_047004 [Adiantum nelumboides]|nr:hypothetical protein [Adiantum nelumboides]